MYINKIFIFPVKRPSVIVAGGYNRGKLNSTEVISGISNTKIQLPNLPKKINRCSMFLHNGSLMFCVMGYAQAVSHKCFQLDKGKWKKHSKMNYPRDGAKVVSTDKGTFIFGGSLIFLKTYEFLPNNPGAKKWNIGKHDIPGGFTNGCAIEVKSKQQIWLIGGGMPGSVHSLNNGDRILSFDINTETFQELPIKLNTARHSHTSAYIPGTNKILVAGGWSYPGSGGYSTEIINTDDGSVTMGGSLNVGRVGHGMGTIKINGKERLIVFGGVKRAKNANGSVELYNAETDQWEMADFNLEEPRFDFGCVTV